MYTVGEENSNYENEYYENSFWSNNKGLIIKIIIIILCVIVLIWLFKALQTKRNIANDESIHIANVEKVRLAAEDYFFIKNNKSDENAKTVNLMTLKTSNLTSDIVDANNKVCNEKSSIVTLDPQTNAYKMTVKLDCSTNDKEEKFLYNNKTLACLDCNGKTNMTGETIVAEKQENIEETKIVIPVIYESEYSCVAWSDWSTTRVNESYLVERSKTLVQGVKYITPSVVYGEWSEYTKTPIASSDNIEVETMTVSENVWSDIKTSNYIDTNNSNIRVINTETIVEKNNTCNGYVLNNTCYSNETVVGNLTFKEYHSGKYNVKNGTCEAVKTLKNSEGKYVLTYVNCEYDEMISKNTGSNSSYTLYTYQELEQQEVTYYRYRTVTTKTDSGKAIYTENKYEENSLPEGYVKVPGTEETYYSYKIETCEK